jgi:N utilization substance protein B
MSKRANSRKLAMRMLYQLGVRENPDLSVIFDDLDKKTYAEETIHWAVHLVKITTDHLTEIDEIIKKLSIDWDMDRLNMIDKALLRMGIGEINYSDTPYQVVLNEIIELSKTYSTDESAKFINGILGNFVKQQCSQD